VPCGALRRHISQGWNPAAACSYYRPSGSLTFQENDTALYAYCAEAGAQRDADNGLADLTFWALIGRSWSTPGPFGLLYRRGIDEAGQGEHRGKRNSLGEEHDGE
jgi:hypothetical protein